MKLEAQYEGEEAVWLVRVQKVPGWRCRRCGLPVIDKTCGCEVSPSPWEEATTYRLAVGAPPGETFEAVHQMIEDLRAVCEDSFLALFVDPAPRS